MSKTVNKSPEKHRDRDSKGRFLPGNKKGFKPGNSGNPKGRPPRRCTEIVASTLTNWKQTDDGEVIELDPALQEIFRSELARIWVAASSEPPSL